MPSFHGQRRLVLLTATVVVCLLLSACGGGPKSIKIGVLLDSSGDLGVYGAPMRDAVNLAAYQINQAGGLLKGKQVEVVYQDSATDPSVAVKAAEQLVKGDKVKAIIGSTASGVTLQVAKSVTVPAQVVLMSPSATSPEITSLQDNDFVFRTVVSDAAQGVVLARLANEKSYAIVAVVYINNAYGRGLAQVFKDSFDKLGKGAVVMIPHESGQTDFTDELNKVREAGAKAVVCISYPETATPLLEQALRRGLAVKYLFADGLKAQSMFDTLASNALEGSFGTAPGAKGGSGVDAFQRLFLNQYGKSNSAFGSSYESSDAAKLYSQFIHDTYPGASSDPYLGESYDAFVLLALAIEKAGAYDGVALRDALREVANPPGVKIGPADVAKALELIRNGQDINYEGAAGPEDFDQFGDVQNTIEVWAIVGGAVVSTGRFEFP